MSALITAVVTMTSREIAELTGKEHKNVIRDIREMISALENDGSDLSHREEKDSRGYTASFHLNRELTETLITGYSIPLRHKVIRRLHELERQVTQPKPPAELSHLEILQLAVESGQKLIAAEAERDKAIRDAVVTVEQVLHGLLGKVSPGNALRVSPKKAPASGAMRAKAYRERKKAAAQSAGVAK